ncbi:MAG TPA: adenosine deaminase [Streptosporangiaceae bacterium]|nr:adenosine deaminase [Streptosporangiaceae bacterium]
MTSPSAGPCGPADPGAFVEQMPKAELHLHIEGTLEPELKFALAARNGVSLGYQSPGQMRAGYAFRDLTSFLAAYYEGMSVLLTEQDFYDLAMAYFRTASAQHVVYAEVFFDPQAHTSRGIGFGTVINGLHRARTDAQAELGLRAQLIMCFLRDMTADSAMATLEQSLGYRDLIVGVGLDSDERDNPPVKFKGVFDRARAEGYRLTAHCDVDQADSVGHIWQCVDDIGVERIDHGVNCVEDPTLVARLAGDGIGLTVCPISNRWVSDGLKAAELKVMLDRSLRATVNSDDPAYFGGYVNQNLAAAATAASLTVAELARLARNSFEIAWLGTRDRDRYLADLDAYTTQNSLPSGS